jgi:tRNA U34 5-methylaminomethyl-2-thiouridine-forming methyltransferase MnmC
MERHIIETEDGSHSLYVPALDEQYHSRHGAVQESRHVFIEAGLAERASERSQISILEIGFGTGLNALLSAAAAAASGLDLTYVAVEAYPLTAVEIAHLNYPAAVGGMVADAWADMHAAPWEVLTQVTPHLRLQKLKCRIEDLQPAPTFDLIYFDAFAPEKQPELWTEEIFGRMYAALQPGGLLVTYCAKGAVLRALQAVGFTVERLQGPPGKREMIRASRAE